MSELVREFFPDAPERCLRCPGLLAAAVKLQEDFRIAGSATAITLETDQASPIRESLGKERFYPTIADAFTEGAVNALTASNRAASELTADCQGTSVVVLHKKRRQQAVTYTSCPSPSFMARFIPVIRS